MMPALLRRVLALLLTLTLLPLSAIAENEITSYSYALTFDMDASAYPAEDQDLLIGIADLLNLLHVEGVYSTDGQGFDNSFTFTLGDAANTTTDLQISGTPQIWWINSSLLGSETLGVNNLALLEFAMKAYAHLEMPLQYIALLCGEYVHTSAFTWIVPQWEDLFEGTKTRTIKRKKLIQLAEYISETGENNRAFYYWVLALARDIGIDSAIFDSLYYLPDWVEDVIHKDGIKITVKNGTETWTTGDKTLFVHTTDESVDTWLLTLPADSAGRTLEAAYSRTGSDFTFEMSITQTDPGDMLFVRVDAVNLPDEYPYIGSSSLSISAGGTLLPHIIELRFNAISDGQHFIISQTDAQTGAAMLTVSGRITAAKAPETLAYQTKPALTDCVNLLSINDASLAALVSNIARPMITGAWPLLVKLPATSFASLFELLEQYDVLEMLINSFN